MALDRWGTVNYINSEKMPTLDEFLKIIQPISKPRRIMFPKFTIENLKEKS